MLTAPQLKDLYFKFFLGKNHASLPSAPLVPENDPSALFVSAGMHPLVPYLLGEPHPLGQRLVDLQECVRTGDIDEVGDNTHHTWFEMLGNWSLGDYFKKESIAMSFDFLSNSLKIKPSLLHVTCFAGDQDSPQDEFSATSWKKLGVPNSRIHFLPKKDNWWGPVGQTGPCGSDTEIFVDMDPSLPDEDFSKGSLRGRYKEIWNNVFMQYFRDEKGQYQEMKQKNVDTGMGVERTVAALSGFWDNYQSPIFSPIINAVSDLVGLSYEDEKNKKSLRLIVDHLRSALFISAAGVEPSNKETGYVLRRLIRRAVRELNLLGYQENAVVKISKFVLKNQTNLAGNYPSLTQNQEQILQSLGTEEEKFKKTLNRGLSQLSRYLEKADIGAPEAFLLYQSYGFPLEMIEEEAKRQGRKVDRQGFLEAQKSHTTKSRTASKGRFAGGLADHSPVKIAYHTATHLLHTVLRQLLGDHVHQAGSNITSDRARFDFTHPEKLSEKTIKEIEDQVNRIISQKLPISSQTMSFAQSQTQKALAFFTDRYPETVTVYTIGDPQKPFSREVCGGPHVDNTAKLKKVKLYKQDSAGSGKRRLYLSFQA